MSAEQDRDQLKSAAVGVAALRVWLGAWFLLTASWKLPVWGKGFDFAARMKPWLHEAASGGAHPSYLPVVEFLSRYATGVAYLSAGVEILIGLGLVLGLFTRWATFFAVVLYANYWAATARMGFSAAGITITIAATAACLFIANAGRFYGLDALRARRSATSLAPPISR